MCDMHFEPSKYKVLLQHGQEPVTALNLCDDRLEVTNNLRHLGSKSRVVVGRKIILKTVEAREAFTNLRHLLRRSLPQVIVFFFSVGKLALSVFRMTDNFLCSNTDFSETLPHSGENIG